MLLASDSWALWSSSPDSSLAVAALTGEQRSQVATSDGADGAIIAWEDLRSGSSHIYAQRMTAAGTPAWPVNGVALSSVVATSPVILSDGTGGAFVGWSTGDIYVQRITSAGSPAAGWPANGIAACTAASGQVVTAIVSDGQGGAILVWYDQRSGNNDIYAQRVTGAGAIATGWPTDGMLVCTGSSQQVPADMVADGAGGAFIVWTDNRAGNPDVYLVRITGAGTLASGWPPNGLAVCTAANEQRFPRLAADGTGGVFGAWEDLRTDTQGDLYAMHLLGNGSPQIGWSANGNMVAGGFEFQGGHAMLADGTGGVYLVWGDARNWPTNSIDLYGIRLNTLGGVETGWTNGGSLLRTAPNSVSTIHMTTDGAGGFIAVWDDIRNTAVSIDVYALRVSPSGKADPGWTQNGRMVCTAPNFQGWSSIVPSGPGGAIVAWKDQRTDPSDIYAQRMGPFAQLGPEPYLVSVSDVINDQGGKAVVEWGASYLEAAAGITSYSVWRRVPGHTLSSEIRAPLAIPTMAITIDRWIRPAQAQALYWEYVGSVPARRFPGYSFVSATTSDSLPNSNPYTSFLVLAESASGSWWASNPDSGYSVDNIPPPAPTSFTAAYVSDATRLLWGASPASDFESFKLYRGSSAGFLPGPGNLIATTTSTGFVDIGPMGRHYKLTATDWNGNEGPFSLVGPDQTTGVPAAPEVMFALEGARPNPAVSGRLLVHFSLPTGEPARLEVIDVAGRRVVERAVGSLGAGRHAVDLVAGRWLPPGVYLVRLTQGVNTRVVRTALLD